MSTRTETVQIVTCDACGAEQTVTVEQIVPNGYSGTVSHTDQSCGTLVYAEWFACNRSHIGSAVNAAIYEVSNRRERSA